MQPSLAFHCTCPSGCSAGIFTVAHDHVTTLLCQLHCLRQVGELISSSLSLSTNVAMGQHRRTYPPHSLYVSKLLADFEGQRRRADCRRTRLSTIGDRFLPVAAPASRIWNILSRHMTSAPSLPVFCSRLKKDLSRRSY